MRFDGKRYLKMVLSRRLFARCWMVKFWAVLNYFIYATSQLLSKFSRLQPYPVDTIQA